MLAHTRSAVQLSPQASRLVASHFRRTGPEICLQKETIAEQHPAIETQKKHAVRYLNGIILRSRSRKNVDIEPRQRHRLYDGISIIWCRAGNREMKKEKLKSTTVRFTNEDFHIIDSLRRRLGLGMVQVIRVAIRRLAQLEKVALSFPKPDDK